MLTERDNVTGIIHLPADFAVPDAASAARALPGTGAPQAVFVPETAVYDLQGRLLTQTFTARALQADVDDPILGNTFMGVPFAEGPWGPGCRSEDGTAGARAAEMIAVAGTAEDGDGRLPAAPFVPLKPWEAIRDVSDAVQ